MENSLTEYSHFDQMVFKKLYTLFRGICFFALFVGTILMLMELPLHVTIEQDPRALHVLFLPLWTSFLWVYIENAKLVIFLILLGAFVPMLFIL